MFKILFKILFSFCVLSTFVSRRAQAAKGSCEVLKLNPVTTSVFTPFKSNGELYFDVIPEYAQHFKDNGVLDIKVAAYIGEASTMNLCDRIALIRAWVDAAKPLGLGVIVQVALGLPFIETLKLAELSVELKVKAISVIPQTIYQAQTVEEAIADLQLIAHVAVGIPILYEDLSPLNLSVSPVDVFKAAAAQIPCFSGIFTSITTASKIKDVTSIANKFLIISGHESVSSAFQMKFNTTGDGATNVFPSLVVAIVAAVKAGDLELAEHLQEELNLKVAAVIGDEDSGTSVGSRGYLENLRAALALITGLKIAIPRLPLMPASLKVVRQIACGLTALGVSLVDTVEGVLRAVH